MFAYETESLKWTIKSYFWKKNIADVGKKDTARNDKRQIFLETKEK